MSFLRISRSDGATNAGGSVPGAAGTTRRLFGAVVLGVVGGFVAASLSACGGSAEADTIRFAAVPSESSQSLQTNFGPVIELIEKTTGKEVEFHNAADYAAVVEGQRAGQIDIASYGPLSYVIAKDSGMNIKAVAAPTNEEGTPPVYHALALVPDDSDITQLRDLKDKTVCLVDPTSTSGYLVPMQALNEEDVDSDADFETVLAGGHDSSLLSVAAGQCDVGFAEESMLQTLEKNDQLAPGELRTVWKSDPIIKDPIAVNTATLDDETVARIREALATRANKPALAADGLCPSVDECVLPEEIEWGYVEVTDADYDSIREMCRESDADACRNVD